MGSHCEYSLNTYMLLASALGWTFCTVRVTFKCVCQHIYAHLSAFIQLLSVCVHPAICANIVADISSARHPMMLEDYGSQALDCSVYSDT